MALDYLNHHYSFPRRELANVVYAASRSGIGRSLRAAFLALECAVERRINDFNVQDLANTANLANAAKWASSRWSTVANAHAVFASSCALNSTKRCFVARANAVNSA